MKYKPEDYIECGFYSDDTEIKNHTEKEGREDEKKNQSYYSKKGIMSILFQR